ncbi:MAG: transcriptional regulator BetI [Pseudomonadota bacterium]
MTRKRIRDIRHEELIGATIAALHENGYAVVTMADIARRAGASAASINYYFGSKERLLEATMRHLLTLLRSAMRDRYKTATTPRERLFAVVEANFDDRLFTTAQCNVWIQFWANAPYSERLARLHRINLARVTSHFRAELRSLLPEARRETARAVLQAYLDGVWLAAAQGGAVEPEYAREEARRVVNALVG